MCSISLFLQEKRFVSECLVIILSRNSARKKNSEIKFQQKKITKKKVAGTKNTMETFLPISND